MPAETSIKVVKLGYILGSKEPDRFRRLDHVHEHQMLARNQIDMLNEGISQRRIVQGGQKYQECTPAKMEPQKCKEIFIIGRNDLRLQSVEGVAANVVMRLACL